MTASVLILKNHVMFADGTFFIVPLLVLQPRIVFVNKRVYACLLFCAVIVISFGI